MHTQGTNPDSGVVPVTMPMVQAKIKETFVALAERALNPGPDQQAYRFAAAEIAELWRWVTVGMGEPIPPTLEITPSGMETY